MAPTILVVDDEPHIVQVLRLKLRNAGYRVVTAADGEEALDCALSEPPDLIITDHHMPYLTGLELGRALAADVRTRLIPILLLTARGYALDQQSLGEANIREVMAKPFSPRALVRHAERLIAAVRGEERRAA